MHVCSLVYLFAILFKDNESISDYTVENSWIIVHNGSEKMWKELSVESLKTLTWHFSGGNEEIQKPLVEISAEV
jgi:hypothetical protein